MLCLIENFMVIVTQEKNAPSKIVLTYCGIEKKQYVLKFVKENEFFHCILHQHITGIMLVSDWNEK